MNVAGRSRLKVAGETSAGMKCSMEKSPESSSWQSSKFPRLNLLM